jgi:hypothetical protein
VSSFKPGDVCVATVRGVPKVRVFHYEYDGVRGWCSDEQVEGETDHAEYVVTDIRPLVVLDFGQWFPEYVAKFPAWLRSKGADAPSGSLLSYLADQLEQQTKPPRIPEPGLWGVVGADWESPGITGIPRAEWMRVKGNLWHSCISPVAVKWDDLIDPTLVRPGIEDGAS